MWRKLGRTILFSPIWLGLLGFVALLFIWKFPMICCERCRAVRYLPYAGLVYYGLTIPFVLVVFGFAWWEVLIGAGLLAFAGDWLLPDPYSYLMSPRKRRAVQRAIEHLEAEEGLRPIYGMVRVIGAETGRTIVSVPIKSDMMAPARRFLAVADKTASVEELGFEYVSMKHGVQGWL